MSNSLLDIVANIMEVEASQIDDDSGPESIENWDSFRGLILFEELESKFNVKFTLNELINVKKIKDIKNILSVRGASLDE
jgi:acyl carrier protein